MKNFCTYVHLIDGTPIYVGEGSYDRPWDFKVRSKDYQKFLQESDVDVVIVGDHGDKVSAELNEQGLISWIGMDRLFNKEAFRYQLTASYGFAGKKHSEEWIEEARKRRLGVKHTPEAKRKMREARLGYVWSDEQKRRMSETKKSRKLECPHCKMIGGVSNMRRYHFDYCKHKP